MTLPFARLASKGIRTLTTPIRLIRLGRSRVKCIKSLAETIQSARRSGFTKEERQCFGKIENKRATLLASDDTIQTDIFWGNNLQRVPAEASKVESIRKICLAGVKPSYGRLLFKLVKAKEPLKSLELGTGIGISTAYISSAISSTGTGNLVTLEGSQTRAKYAESIHKSLDLNKIDYVVGPFNQTLKTLLEEYQNIDFCYIDGHHDGSAMIEYFNNISPVLSDDSIVIMDDINWSDDMNRAWKIISEKKEVALAVDTYMMGICLIKKDTKDDIKSPKQTFEIMYW